MSINIETREQFGDAIELIAKWGTDEEFAKLVNHVKLVGASSDVIDGLEITRAYYRNPDFRACLQSEVKAAQ